MSLDIETIKKAHKITVRRFKKHDRVKIHLDGYVQTWTLRVHVEDMKDPLRSVILQKIGKSKGSA